MGVSKSVFAVEKDNYISGVVVGNDPAGIVGYYTSPLGNVSQYNFSPVIVSSTIGTSTEIKKGEFVENPKSIKFPDGYFLQQIYKSANLTDSKELTLSMEFVTVNKNNDVKSFIYNDIRKESHIKPEDVPNFNYRSTCGDYITGINGETTFGSYEKFNVVCPQSKLPTPTAPTPTAPGDNNIKILIIICVIVLGIYLYTQNTPASNAVQKVPNNNLNNIQQSSVNYF